jgi:hypothetical protein
LLRTLLSHLLCRWNELRLVDPDSGRDVADEARRARERLTELPDGQLFDLDLLMPTVTAASEALARGTWAAGAVSEAWVGVLEIVEARTRLLELSSRLAAMRQDVAALAEGTRPEQQLFVSSRFAPLAGSQLAGFGAFLDRPLRRYDYYAGVYEAVHCLAVGVCTNEPPSSPGELPVRLERDPSEIDLTATTTQRCIGQVTRHAIEIIGLRVSPQARYVVARLADLELAASLGSSSRALLLRSEPSWAWLDSVAPPAPGDPVVATFEALTAAKVPCGLDDHEALCPAELSFESFLAALSAHGYRPTSETMALAMRDPASGGPIRSCASRTGQWQWSARR